MVIIDIFMFSHLFLDYGGITLANTIFRDVSGGYGSGCQYAAFLHRHAGTHHRFGTYPRAVLQHDGPGLQIKTLFRIVMIAAEQHSALADAAVPAYLHIR